MYRNIFKLMTGQGLRPVSVALFLVLTGQAAGQDTFGVGPSNGGSVTAGVPFTLAVTALSPCCPSTIAIGYGDPISFTSNDSRAVLPPATSSFPSTAGVTTFTATLYSASPPADTAITIIDPEDLAITGYGLFTVLPGPVSQFGFAVPASAVEGVPFSFAVTAVDAYGNVVTGYTGPISFSSTDSSAVFGTPTWTSGVGSNTGTFHTVGSQTIHAADTSNGAASTSGLISVLAPTATATFTFTPTSTFTATPTVTETSTATATPTATLPPPTLSGLYPSSGLSTGGYAVTLIGSNFALPAVVTFGGASAAVNSVSSTQIVVTTPNGNGTAAVVVTVAGQASNNVSFTYLVATATFTPSYTPTATPSSTPTATFTHTPVPPTATFTYTPTGSATPTPTPNAPLYLDQNFFNPQQQRLGMDVRVDQAGEVKLEVFNLTGEIVRKIADQVENAGNYRFYWDGRNDTGAVVGNAVYFIVIQTPSGNQVRKVIVLK